MISFSLVDVKNITSEISRSSFPETVLDQIAEMILESGGLIKPLVLKVTGAESYTVVDGHFEYYAAIRAREKNPHKGEMVNAFVISPKSENIVAKQAKALRIESPDQQVKPDTTNLESRLANIELRLEKQISELRSEQAQERQRVEDKLKEIKNLLPKAIEPLETFNSLKQNELAIKLKLADLPENTAEKLAKEVENARRNKNNKKFVDLRDVVKSVNGLGEVTMLKIIDKWSGRGAAIRN